MLEIRVSQRQTLSDHHLIQKISKYLQRNLPEKTAVLSQEELTRFSIQSVEDGKALEIYSERALAKWAYLRLLTDHTLTDSEDIRAYMKPSEVPASIKVDRLMKSVAVAVDSQQQQSLGGP